MYGSPLAGAFVVGALVPDALVDGALVWDALVAGLLDAGGVVAATVAADAAVVVTAVVFDAVLELPQAATTSNDNANPLARTLFRRISDLDMCSPLRTTRRTRRSVPLWQSPMWIDTANRNSGGRHPR